MGQLTELDAVNRILRGNGEQPVSSLVTDGTNDTSIASAVLSENLTHFSVQFGDEVNIEAGINSTGKIPLSPNILRLDGRDTDRHRRLVRRGNYLFDVDNNTDTFTAAVKLRVIYQQEFEDLDPAFQYMICDQAAVQYQADVKGDREVDQRLRARAMQSRIAAMAKLAGTRNRNWLNTTDQERINFRVR
jgi:hypothetical protein